MTLKQQNELTLKRVEIQDDINQLQAKIEEMQETQQELVDEIKNVQNSIFGAEEAVKALQSITL